MIALLEFDAPKHDSILKRIRVSFPIVKIRDELQFYLDTSTDTARDLIIFDEIQRCPRAGKDEPPK